METRLNTQIEVFPVVASSQPLSCRKVDDKQQQGFCRRNCCLSETCLCRINVFYL